MTRCTFSPCIVIPVYNHAQALKPLLVHLLAKKLPIILVDDGSDEPCRLALEKLAAQHSSITLLRLVSNQGKGGAVKQGLRKACQLGFSHGLQIDADGQHDPADVAQFVQFGQRHPKAIICGCPVFDASVPRLRYWARYLTHVWVWINSLSLSIKDSMCGFRLYPLAAIVTLIDDEAMGNRMEFDTEVMVRWSWRGGQVINLPTSVCYPSDGVSHFLAFRDNMLISKMHTRLFFGMLWRLPTLLRHKISARKLAKPS